ncbi:uncharacterized protein LOC141649657 [Silene latifolia]|uniref:uncharacterized protein LOC141649657 n=1 Tax=Silene latifolia TaxID=37657 RepID=UPI003D788962
MDPIYPEELFRRRFRMHKHLFMRIVNALSANDRFFQQRAGGNGRPSFSPLQRYTVTLRVLAYSTSTDSVDEYLHISHTSVRDSLKLFVEGVINCFGNEYLRMPKPQDLGRLLHMGQDRGFPGMLGSRLHALGVEKLSHSMSGTICREKFKANSHFGSGRFIRFMDMACLLRYTRFA